MLPPACIETLSLTPEYAVCNECHEHRNVDGKRNALIAVTFVGVWNYSCLVYSNASRLVYPGKLINQQVLPQSGR